MIARITKRQVVLDRMADEQNLHERYGYVMFAVSDDEGDADLPELYVAEADFRALGEPEQITVTIEPGDRLGEETTNG